MSNGMLTQTLNINVSVDKKSNGCPGLDGSGK